MSIIKRAALASAMASVLVLGVATTAHSETSTNNGVFTVDATTVKAGSKVNLSIVGLNSKGEVDTAGESFGSRIVAVVSSSKGEVEALGSSGTTEDPALFEKGVDGGATRYVRLKAGIGKVNISYPVEAGGTTDTINITLQEVIFPNEAGGTTVNVIDSTQKIITVDNADLDVALLDITEFTGGDTNDSDAIDEGIDGVTTAGKEGAQVKVVAYKDIVIDYAMGNVDTPKVSGQNINNAVSGLVTLVFRPAAPDEFWNFATDSITLDGNMSKGEATIYIPSEVTVAAKYYMEATLEGYDNLSSVDMYNNDTIVVNPVSQPKKLLLNSEKATISDNADKASGTQLEACMLDQYGNKTKANQGYTVNLKDDTEHVSNTAISFIFSNGDVCVSDSGTILGDVQDEALKLGTAEMVAHIKNQTSIADSDPTALKIVADQLVAEISSGWVTSVQAGVSITKNVLGYNAFHVRKDNGDGVFATGTDSLINTGGPTGMSLNHYAGNKSIESTNSTVGQNEDQLGARFDVISGTGLNEYYIISTEDGAYGEFKVLAAIAGPDIIPASPADYKMIDGHGQTISSMKATPKPGTDPIEFWALFRENNIKLTDDYGNSTSPSLPIKLISPNGTVNDHDYLNANEVGGAMSSVTYDPITFVGGEDSVQLVFQEPKLEGSNIKVEVPVKQELTEIKLDVENGRIPVNGVVPVRVTSWDQFGELFPHPKGVFLQIDADSSVGVRVYYVKADGDDTGQIANNTSIPDSSVNPRSVIVVEALNGTTGTFSLTVRNADNNITATQDFEITTKFEAFKVEPTEISTTSGQPAAESVTVSGGSAPYTVASVDASVADATLGDDGTTVTITAAEVIEAGSTTITVTDSNGKTVSIAVTVTAPASQDECEAEGNIYDAEGNCQPLPNTGGTGGEGSTAVDKNGNFTTSAAEFTGGWTNTGTYTTSIIISQDGGDATAAQLIHFDPAHDGQEVDIILVLAVQLPPSFGPLYWYFFSGTSGIVGPTLALDIAGIEALETHTVVADEPKVMGPYVFENLVLPVADFMFYFGYRTSDGTIYFSGEPITLQVR